MAAGRIILCYFLSCLPILAWYLICKYMKDYGILLAAEILVCHILIPVIVRAISDNYYHIGDLEGRYYKTNFDGAEVELTLVIVLYIVGLGLLSFVRSSKAWNYHEKILLFPVWRKWVVIIYAVVVALVALLVYPITEHYFYIGFLYLNMRFEKGYKVFIVVLSLLNSVKWFFLFNESVKSRGAAVFWTILWVILYLIIDLRSWERNYYTGIGLKQVLMLMYVITLTLYALGVRCRAPKVVSLTRIDDRLTRLR